MPEVKNRKSGLNRWCDRTWIKVGLVIALAALAAILVNWNRWGTDLKVIAAIAVLIPLHVVEEWVFPGGFHYQYNVVLCQSDKPNSYPMCRLSDMFTNLVTTVFYVVLAFIAVVRGNHVNPGMLMGTLAFSVLEVFAHTLMGTKMYFRFREKGKTTITGIDWGICFGILGFIGILCVLLPEKIIKDKDTPYYFESSGYFERFQ